MKRYDLITPEGTRDLLFEGCLARRMVEDRLSKLFEGFGYSEVVTPGVLRSVYGKFEKLPAGEPL